MPAYFRRNYRQALAVIVLIGGALLSSNIGDGTSKPPVQQAPYSALDAPAFEARLTHDQLVLTTTTASAAHRSALKQVIAEDFSGLETVINFRPGVVVADGWETASMRLLHMLAATDAATAVMDEDEIIVRGVLVDAPAFNSRLELLREALPPDMVIDEDMIQLEDKAALVRLCRATFSKLASLSVEFHESSADIRPSSFSTLDRFVDFAFDCSPLRISITGHSDASGDEAWNRHLSRLRAQAVSDYLIRGGVPPEQLLVDGVGSSVPIADNSTEFGRSVNRRIEFGLIEPPL